ncbi:hypothetical protein JCM3774_006541 [Rhodotorula dairenensis]
MAPLPTRSRHFSPVTPQVAAGLNPYLGARAHLSLSWLSQHFLALVLVLVTLAYLLTAIPTLVREAKLSLSAACQGVQGAANVAVSMPHYMADGVNELNVKAINAITHGAGTMLDLLLQALEAIVLFMIDMYRSLYLCLLDLAVHGSITVLVRGIEEAQEFVTEAMQGVRTTIQAAVSGVNSGLEHTIGLVDKIPGVNIDVPQIDVPQLSALENVTLPNTLVNALENLNSTIPTVAEVRASLDALVSRPIDDLRASINSTLRGSTLSVEVLPVPPREQVELCAELDTTWIDDVGEDLAHFVRVAIGLVVVVMLLFLTANAIWERYRYRVFLGGVDAAREAWLRDLSESARAHVGTVKSPAFEVAEEAHEALSRRNLLSFLNASRHPTLFKHANRVSSFLSLRTSAARTNLIWFLSYIAHPYACGFLVLGIVGLVVVQIQIAVLDGPVRNVTHQRAEQGAGEFSSSVAETLNSKMSTASQKWANGTNAAILELETGINENLFSWVNTTTETLNSTMNGFYDEVTDTLTAVFNETVLQDPALGLVYCLVGSKVDAISSALTWIHAHAHLSLPTVSPSILLLSPNRTEDLTASLTNPELSISAPSIADRMINAYLRSLEQQRMGFFVAIGIWALVLLMGIIGAWWRAAGCELWQHWRGANESAGGDPDDQTSHGDDAEKMRFAPLRALSTNWLRAKRSQDTAEHPVSLPLQQSSVSLPAFAVEPATPATLSHRSVSPSSRSWASLVEFFKATDTADATASSVPAHREPKQSPRLRPLALPTVRTCAAFSAAKGRLRPVISPPRPLLNPFRALGDSDLARQERRSGPDGDLVLLRDESRSKSKAGPAKSALRAALGRSRTRSSGVQGSKGGEDGPFNHCFEADGELSTPYLPPLHAGGSDCQSSPPSPPWTSRTSLVEGWHLPTCYGAPSRPLAATNPFATPFDD